MSDRINTYTVRSSGISYLLPSGKSGTITDPAALRTFYTKLYNHEIKHQEKDGKEGRKYARRLSPRRGTEGPA